MMSASGLVFFHYGFQIIKKLFPKLELSEIQFFMDYIYDNYMVCIDAVDNGVDAYKEDYLYQTSQLTLQSHVKKLNKYRDFDYACNYVFDDFKLFAQYSFDFVLPGASVLKHAVQNRFQVHSSGKAMLIMEDVMVDKLIKY